MREKYKNPDIDRELNNFKNEIEDKFLCSDLNNGYMFPRKSFKLPKSIEDNRQH